MLDFWCCDSKLCYKDNSYCNYNVLNREVLGVALLVHLYLQATSTYISVKALNCHVVVMKKRENNSLFNLIKK